MNKKNFILFPRNLKGDVSLPILIGMVTLIAAAVVIFIFMSRLGIQTIADEEICYNSVVTRSGILELSNDLAAPALNCKTRAYCISKDGTCEIMSSSTNIIQVETSDDVYRAIAEKMASCWSQYGEGKLDYAGGKADKYFYCSNCYQLGFDNSLNMFSNNEIDERELYRYMSQANVSGKDTTYLKYLISVNAATMEQNIHLVDAEFKKIEIGKQYFITMGIYSDIALWKAIYATLLTVPINIYTLVTQGSFTTPPLFILFQKNLLGVIIEGDSGQQFLTPTLVEANSEAYESLKCTSVLTLS